MPITEPGRRGKGEGRRGRRKEKEGEGRRRKEKEGEGRRRKEMIQHQRVECQIRG
jgi:hypothetical protein